jgi:hypothetical protein
VDRYDEAKLVAAARFLLAEYRRWWKSRETEDQPYTEPPKYHWHYLMLKQVIESARKKRKAHDAAVRHIWQVYAESCLETYRKNQAESPRERSE